MSSMWRWAGCCIAFTVGGSPGTLSILVRAVRRGLRRSRLGVASAFLRCTPAAPVAAAIYETVLHDVPVAAKLKSVPVGLVRQRLHSTLVVRRALRLVSLREPDLKKWSIDRRTLIGSLPTRYAGTARWAQAIHSQFPDVDGLVLDLEPV